MLGNQAKSELVKSQGADAPRNRSNFPLNHHHYSTLKFGEIAPFFEMESVGGDKITLRSAHKLSTFTLKSPILSDVHLNKDYFNVPMEAILPFNWEKIYANPVVGDDVTADQVNSVFVHKQLNVDTTKSAFAKLMLLYTIYGKAGLAARLGIALNPLMQLYGSATGKTLDVDAQVNALFAEIYEYAGQTAQIKVTYVDEDNAENYIITVLKDKTKLRELVRFCQSHCVTKIEKAIGTNIIDPTSNAAMKNVKYQIRTPNYVQFNLNIAPIVAYQIVCAHYYTNDRVDYVYSAEMYRQLLKAYITNINTEVGTTDYFLYNGIQCPYDYVSGYNIQRAFGLTIETNTRDFATDRAAVNAFYYLYHIFKINRSLRYSDFFTGSKVRPLAVGDVAIDVNHNAVSAVDVTRNIQAQRFLNFVNRVGRKFEEYVGKLTGVYVKPDFHNPQYLGATKELLFNSKLENTATEQWTQANSVTSQYIGNSKDYAFEFDSDRPSIVLGLISFDIERAYNRSINPEAYHIDRFDYFNPFMQHIGDQEVPTACYDASLALTQEDKTFGYQTRHAEYKEKFSYCDGGFNDGSLPSWLFVNKPTDEKVISPEVIRSYPEEFDEFYLMLDGLTSDYFHFIVDFYNICDASRPMIKSPNIL